MKVRRGNYIKKYFFIYMQRSVFNEKGVSIIDVMSAA